jgi:hypothetical protein
MSKDDQEVVARYQAGKLGRKKDLEDAMQQAWTELLEQPNTRAELAAIFKVPGEQLPKRSPYVASVSEGGITGAEIAIAFAAAFVLAIAKEAGSAAGKKAWAVLRRQLESDKPEALGEELKPKDS